MSMRFVISILLAVAICGCSLPRRATTAKPAAAPAPAPQQASAPAMPQIGSWMQVPEYSSAGAVPPMDGSRKISDQDCTKGIDLIAGNLRCK